MERCKYRITLPAISRRQHLPMPWLVMVAAVDVGVGFGVDDDAVVDSDILGGCEKGTEVCCSGSGLGILSRQIRVAYRRTFAH